MPTNTAIPHLAESSIRRANVSWAGRSAGVDTRDRYLGQDLPARSTSGDAGAVANAYRTLIENPDKRNAKAASAPHSCLTDQAERRVCDQCTSGATRRIVIHGQVSRK